MTKRWWKTGALVLAAAALLTSVASAVIIQSTNLPYEISWYGRVDYNLPGDIVAFNGIQEGDPYGIDIIIRFAYYVDGPMTFWYSKDAVNWTWAGDSHWMISPAEPYSTLRLAGNSWDPTDFAKYIRIDNCTYYNDTYKGVIKLAAVEPFFPGRDPRLPPPNQAPAAANDTALTQMSAAITINVLANDTDPESDPLTIDSFAQGASGTVAAAEGGLTYTPNAGFSGTDTFTYVISDGHNHTATATVTVTVNKAPVAAPDAGQTEVGMAITIPVLANDLDGDGDALIIMGVGAAANGSAAVNTDGTVTYTPNAGFAGQDEFSYVISDGKGGASTAEVFIVTNPKNVLIDIKPGGNPNNINLGSNGVVPIAILSTASFDATTVDPATVSMAGAGVAVRGKANRYLASNQDVNADGRLDLVLQVETENLDPSQLQNGYATVVGTTLAGVPIIGTDSIILVPPK